MPTKFIVIKGRINSPPLISKTTFTKLGMLQIREDGLFAKPNDLRILVIEGNIDAVMVNTEQPQIKEILGKHNSAFQGIGKIRDVKKNEEFPCVIFESTVTWLLSNNNIMDVTSCISYVTS